MKVGILDGDVHGPNIPKLLGVDHLKPAVSELGLVPVPTRPNLTVISMAFMLTDVDTPVAWRWSHEAHPISAIPFGR